MKTYTRLVIGLFVAILLAGCVTNLSFSSRPDYATVLEARNLPIKKNRPIAIKWLPPTFPEMRDVQAPEKGGYGSASSVVVPTGASLASRILELVDASVGYKDTSRRLLRIAVFVAESKFEFSSDLLSGSKTIVAANCVFEAEFIIGNKAWTERFYAELRDPSVSAISQTAILEKVWDDIALQVAKSIALNTYGV